MAEGIPSEPRLTPAQRAAAVGRIHENLALSSGAGCGKTYVLARRFTELLLACGSAGNPLSRFVALTFTEKAAREMSLRVRRMLSDFAAAAGSEADRRKLLGWLEEAGEARISTIHSFCSALLRSHAVEAGVDPNFAVCADDLVTAQMMDEAADQAVLTAVESEADDAAALVSRLTFSRAVDQVRWLLEHRVSVALREYVSAEAVLTGWRARLAAQQDRQWELLQADDTLSRRVEAVASAWCNDTLEAIRGPLLAAVGRLRADRATWSDGGYEAMAEIAPGRAGGPKGTACRHAMKALKQTLASHACLARRIGPVDDLAAAQLATLARLALAAEALYGKAKRDAGLLDFDDLMLAAHRLLATNAPLRQQLSAGIEQLLIDECQDTDRFQLELLGYVLGMAGLDGAGVDDVDTSVTRPGRLFIVGDPKQSIYRFRGAQVEVFEALCRRLGARQQEHLDTSFRTHDAGVSFVNHVFGRLMGADYLPTFAHRQTSPPEPSVEILLADAAEAEETIDSASKATAAQAAVVAARIRQMLDDGERLVWDRQADRWRAVRAGDIAILFARMTKSQEYERELMSRGVPYYVESGTGFFKQQEVYDVLNALRAIDNPRDEIALTGVLRSAMVGLDDNDLLRLAWAGGLRFDGLSARARQAAGLGESSRRRLVSAVEIIERLHRRKDSLGIDEIVRALLDATGYEAVLLGRRNGARLCGNVRQLAERARSASESGMSLADFVVRMDELVLNESRCEQAAVAGEAQDVVRIMTVHKAKGLEFPVVFVPDLNAGRKHVRGVMLHRGDWGLTYRPAGADVEEDADGEALPASYESAKELEQADQHREDVRKLYVAMTRHEDHLVLVGANWRRKNADDAGEADAAVFAEKSSYLAQLDGVLGVSACGGEASSLDVPYSWEAGGRAGKHYVARVRCVRASLLRQGYAGRDRQAATAGAGIDDRLIAAVPADVSRTELAVTALGDFARCPLLFHWRHELAVPGKFLHGGAADMNVRPERDAACEAVGEASRGLDAAEAGTFFHRCMEWLDLADPVPAATVGQVLAEMELDADAAALTAELHDMVDRLRPTALWAMVQSARQVLRELPFVLALDGATLRGQIDMLIEAADGRWHVIDYKSDRVSADRLAERAEGYRVQMLLYAMAAWRHTGTPPAQATLYFLRPGLSHSFDVSPAALEHARQHAQTLTRQLAETRRSGAYGRNETAAACGACAYRELCGR